MQGLGGADEIGGADSSGADGPCRSSTRGRGVSNELFARADAFLFGRRTFEIFADSGERWPTARTHRAALNAQPKYVARPRSPTRNGRNTVLSGDIAAAVDDLKPRPGGELQVHGSGELIRWLHDHDLIDEITLFTCSVVIGQGTRLFPDTGPDPAFELVDSRSAPNGVIQVYRPSGRPQYAPATPDQDPPTSETRT